MKFLLNMGYKMLELRLKCIRFGVFFLKIPQVGAMARILSIKLAINGDCQDELLELFFAILLTSGDLQEHTV